MVLRILLVNFMKILLMSTTAPIQAEASKPQTNKMQEYRRCKAAGFPNQLIGFEKVGEDYATGKISWKLVDENNQEHKQEHKHKNIQNSPSTQNEKSVFRHRRIVDISTVTDLQKAKKLLELGWEYKTSYPATISNIPHYVIVKRG
jgi:hypothetical protein